MADFSFNADDFSFNADDYSDECLSPPVVYKKYIEEVTCGDVTAELQLVNAEREELTTTSIQKNTPRSVYLVTYSKADTQRLMC